MAVSKVEHQSFQARLSKENHAWLRRVGESQERSINWTLNKVVSDARLAHQKKEEEGEIAKAA
ncbi:hypothetical protein K5M36_16630 [Chromobacterium vaccinii]|nr:hypothetical protein [Chromobacterium vaccinii]